MGRIKRGYTRVIPPDELKRDYRLFAIACEGHREKEYLEQNNRTTWIKEEIEDLVNPDNYNQNPENAWLRIRHNNHSLTFLNVLKALACWRELRAIRQNVSRQNIIKDDMLVNISTAFPFPSKA